MKSKSVKLLSIIPPYIPSYFNAGHHLPVFTVGEYLRSKFSSFEINCIDAGALNYTWKDICDLLIRKYDYIILLNDFDTVDNFERFIKYVRKLSPKAKLITFGRLSNQVPGFFENLDLDAIVVSGDYEAGVEAYINYSLGITINVPGVRVKIDDNYTKSEGGIFLEADNWKLPDVNDIPYAAYDFLYKRDSNKFCGIPDRRELVIPIARGCPVGCSFCDVPFMQGKTERRISVKRTLQYIIESFKEHNFEYYSFYCPTFTLNKKWVIEFCMDLLQMDINYPWKCVTVIGMLNEELIKLMSQAGCIRISVGLETLDQNAAKGLPRIKQDSEYDLINISNLCKQNNIELNCFVILGLPGDSIEGVKYTVSKVLEAGARVRPTIYTPYELLNAKMDINQINNFNRQLFVDGTINEELESEYYNLFYNNESDFETIVMKNIPTRRDI